MLELMLSIPAALLRFKNLNSVQNQSDLYGLTERYQIL